MSDFAQHGLIATLQRLNDAHLPVLEAELLELARERPTALILPCHARDLHQPALAHIVEELCGAAWLGEVVLSLNGFTSEDARYAEHLFTSFPLPYRICWNDDGGKPLAGGKGANFRAALRQLSAQPRIVAAQDCDVASFRRADLARLCYAVAHPDFDYRFAKGYYSRVTDRLYGRVSRLFFQPLLHAMLRVAGHQPLLDFLVSFRYPLAGEVAMTRDLAVALPAADGWGLEIAHLCQVFRTVDPRQICQVDGGGGYDHKHHPATGALTGMTAELARELFAQVALEGMPSDAEFRIAVAKAYRSEAEHALQRSASLARINALPFDLDVERATVAAFAERLDLVAKAD